MVSREPAVEVPAVDLAGLPEEGRRTELDRLYRAEAQRPFDLARGPLLRAAAVRLCAGEHVLFVNLHHIISDGWSRGVLFRELAALYGGLAPAAAADPVRATSPSGSASGCPARPWRPSSPTGAGSSPASPASWSCPATGRGRRSSRSAAAWCASSCRPSGAGLTALTRRGRATLSMTLLAGFEALLSRLAGQDDFAVGVAIANRTRRELEGLIGFFVNTLVLRGRSSPGPGFLDHLGGVRETSLAAYAHQDLPFERLVEELHPERDLGRNPLDPGDVRLPELPAPGRPAARPGDRPPGRAGGQYWRRYWRRYRHREVRPHPLPGGGGGAVSEVLEYNTDLFDAATARRLLGGFESLLAAAVARPEAPLGGWPC